MLIYNRFERDWYHPHRTCIYLCILLILAANSDLLGKEPPIPSLQNISQPLVQHVLFNIPTEMREAKTPAENYSRNSGVNRNLPGGISARHPSLPVPAWIGLLPQYLGHTCAAELPARPPSCTILGHKWLKYQKASHSFAASSRKSYFLIVTSRI